MRHQHCLESADQELSNHVPTIQIGGSKLKLRVPLNTALQEGKELMASKAYANAGEKSTTACVLRLTDRYTGNGLIIFGDSWFTSLNTVKKLATKGIFFVGMIQQEHSGIPDV
jgi:hypothetical protein